LPIRARGQMAKNFSTRCAAAAARKPGVRFLATSMHESVKRPCLDRIPKPKSELIVHSDAPLRCRWYKPHRPGHIRCRRGPSTPRGLRPRCWTTSRVGGGNGLAAGRWVRDTGNVPRPRRLRARNGGFAARSRPRSRNKGNFAIRPLVSGVAPGPKTARRRQRPW